MRVSAIAVLLTWSLFGWGTAAAESEAQIGRDIRDSTPAVLRASRPPAGSPNVVVILLDDLGYADLGPYGSEIETPSIDRLAAEGLRYRQFTVTSVCSPTRAALLTGLNHHSAGTGWLAEADMGYPGYRGAPTRDALMLPEILAAQGYATLMVGKWHLTLQVNKSRVGPFESWPTGRGFQRYWGFLDGETSQHHPHTVVRGTAVVDYPTDGSFYLPDALTDEAISMLRDLRDADPEQPFFLYYATGAPHAPHHTRAADRAKYRGRYDVGWDAVREQRLSRQIDSGLVPAGTRLAPYSPHVRPWDELSDAQRRMYARLQENYAAFVDNIDQNVGRLLDYLEEIGKRENTLVLLTSDNGASREVGPEGSWNAAAHFYHHQPATTADNLPHYDEIGEATTHPHYPHGWMQASNTPFIHAKRSVFAGGVNVPLIVSWPRGIAARGEVRSQFHHVTDVAPTILELLGVEHPRSFEGRDVKPLEGVSFAYSFEDAEAASTHREQYYEIEGQRAYYADGWRIVAWRPDSKQYDEVPWQLYDLRHDFSESRDLAQEHPERVAALESSWWQAARRHQVLPINDAPLFSSKRASFEMIASARTRYAYARGTPMIYGSKQPLLFARSYEISARVERPTGSEQGAIVARGGIETGWALFIHENRLVYEYNVPNLGATLVSSEEVPRGASTVGFRFTRDAQDPLSGTGALLIDGREVGSAALGRPLSFSNEGLDVARDTLTPVSRRYASPFDFEGRLDEVVFELGPLPGGGG
jgi:arylsulfatase